ncbi:GH15 family glucan-1,4-alpha-glucosidase [Sphingomonas zeicaulis]|uniref:glycoside hydrolase family 15 protein n=1 Tax=Sphingomonas zeicaulis TaxID=1632740 RepID=UPI003D1BD3AC
MAKPPRRIGDHGIIGDLETAALVAKDGTIDYLCWPSLDSPTIFADLLHADEGGSFSITPDLTDPRTSQLYVPGTNVLITRFMAEDGSAEILDMMPLPGARSHPDRTERCLIRKVTATRGAIRFAVLCRPLFDYARVAPSASARNGVVTFDGGEIRLCLSTSVPLEQRAGAAFAHFTLSQGESAWFMLGEEPQARLSSEIVDKEIAAAVLAWRRWLDQSTYTGRWRDEVHRSALTLKLLTSVRHGSIAAAATFSLPEATGAGRNWDYRAVWIRDASFTSYALMRLGFFDEAKAFYGWMSKRMSKAADGNTLRIMYAIDGSEAREESELPHLAGYAGSRPVRIGNAAHAQTQLDIYGELLDSIYLFNKYSSSISHEGWLHVCSIVEHVIEHWEEADAGIWEIRDEPRHFLHSRLMCWVALDRAVRLANKRSLPAPLASWIENRDRVASDIWTNFRHPDHGYFVQSRGGSELDAALLMMPLVRFVSATDPVWLSTLDAISDVLRDDGMIYRYRNADGLEGGEGAFTTCIFWYAECLARAGRLEQAQLVLAQAMSYANELGLFSEELDLRGEALGNFPQALTHLAFISAAHFIDRQLDPSRRPHWQP